MIMDRNYDRFPATRISGRIIKGWESIRKTLSERGQGPLAVDFYTGVYEDEVIGELSKGFGKVLNTRDLMKPEDEVLSMTSRFMTDDVLFGYVSPLRMVDFFDSGKLESARADLTGAGADSLIIGPGAALVAPDSSTLVYLDMARWEIQQRFRRHEVRGLGVDNRLDPVSIQYKRGYFIDWKALDYYKDGLFGRIDEIAKGDIRKKITDLLGAFMFGGDASTKKVKVLSGGEKTRLAILKLLLEPVNLLILDEPTNHLDIKTKDVLKQALQDFDGTLICVSHDRDFLDGLCTKVYEFGNKKVREHLCGVYEFLETKKMESLQELERKD